MSGAVAAGWTFTVAVDAFVVTNVVIGLSCGVAGLLIAWGRPRNPVGWLLLAAAASQSGTAAAAPLLDLAAQHEATVATLRTLATVPAYAWPFSIATFLPLALAAICDALRLPSAAVVRDGRERARHGGTADAVESVPLVYRGEPVGELLVGVRSGQRALDRTDRAALEVLAAPLAVAVRATELSDSLQRSRERIVAAREEERRRLRRDLHDGLGPALTGISFQADAAGNLLTSDPARSAELLVALRAAATEPIDDVRRLVHDLRPPALAEGVGLTSITERAAELGGSVRLTPGDDGGRVVAALPLGAVAAS